GNELARAAGAAAHQDQLAHTLRIGQREGDRAVAAHGIADDVHALEAELVQQALEHTRIEFRARTGADDGVALAPARAVEQDHTVTRFDQGIDVAMEVGPAGCARPRAVQHDYRFRTLADIVV